MHKERITRREILQKRAAFGSVTVLPSLSLSRGDAAYVTSPSHKCDGFSNHACDTFRYVTV